MLAQIASHAYPELFSSVYSGELQSVVSVNPTNADPKTPVKTMNRERRPIGWNRGVPDYTFDLEMAVGKQGLEADFEKLSETMEEFTMVFEADDGGIRLRYEGCVVTNVSYNANEAGEMRATVSVAARRYFREA